MIHCETTWTHYEQIRTYREPTKNQPQPRNPGEFWLVPGGFLVGSDWVLVTFRRHKDMFEMYHIYFGFSSDIFYHILKAAFHLKTMFGGTERDGKFSMDRNGKLAAVNFHFIKILLEIYQIKKGKNIIFVCSVRAVQLKVSFDFTCKFSFRVFIRCSLQVWAFFLLILCLKEVLGKYG